VVAMPDEEDPIDSKPTTCTAAGSAAEHITKKIKNRRRPLELTRQVAVPEEEARHPHARSLAHEALGLYAGRVRRASMRSVRWR